MTTYCPATSWPIPWLAASATTPCKAARATTCSPGGLGDDTYVFARGDGADVITESSADANYDTIAFLAGVNIDQLWFRQVGADLDVSTIGTTDKITIRAWNAAVPNIEEFRTAAGHVMRGADVQLLVQAMANLTPPPLGQLTLPAGTAAALAPALAQAWHFNGPTQPTGQTFVGTAGADVINGHGRRRPAARPRWRRHVLRQPQRRLHRRTWQWRQRHRVHQASTTRWPTTSSTCAWPLPA